jgi:hydroxyethylthiazole kinase-like uncharacterized protein yjeF
MIWTASEAQEIDRLSTAVHHIPSIDLMEEAGLKAYHFALRQWKPYAHFIVLAGAGNNGGDALVVARHLMQAGFSLEVFDLASDKESEERLAARIRLEQEGLSLHKFTSDSFDHLKGKDLIIIDGLLGLGMKGKMRPGIVENCLKAAAALKPKVVIAIDLPSGLDADAWEQDAPLLAATHTITFGEKKPVHLLQPSRHYCGETTRVPLNFRQKRSRPS